MQENNNVSVGPTSVIGWGTAFTTMVGAVVAYFTGKHSGENLVALELAGGSFLTLSMTQLARYLQAHKMIGLSQVVEAAGPVIEAGESALEGNVVPNVTDKPETAITPDGPTPAQA